MNVTELDLFDFDGTLFRSPAEPKGYSGMWWDDPKSLQPPLVPAKPSGSWFLNPAKGHFRKSKANPRAFTAVITGRKEPFRRRVLEILTAGGLKPDELFLSPGGPTSPYKVATMRYLKRAFPYARLVRFWEDRHHHLEEFERAANKMGLAFEPHPVTPPSPTRVASRFLRDPR